MYNQHTLSPKYPKKKTSQHKKGREVIYAFFPSRLKTTLAKLDRRYSIGDTYYKIHDALVLKNSGYTYSHPCQWDLPPLHKIFQIKTSSDVLQKEYPSTPKKKNPTKNNTPLSRIVFHLLRATRFHPKISSGTTS